MDPDNKPLGNEHFENIETPKKIVETKENEVSDNQFFFEDEVFRIDTNGRFKFGMIIGTYDSYDEGEYDILNKGYVHIAWYPSCNEQTLREREIGLVDRTLMPGDIVKRLVPGRSSERGYVMDVKVCADVRILNSSFVIRDVKTERLSNVMGFRHDEIVCLDSWVGTTRITEDRVVLSTSYGARFELPSQVYWAFEDYEARNLHGIYQPYIMFPGNILVGRLPSVDSVKLLTPDIPLRVNKRGNPLTELFTVESVTVDSAWINWQCKALSDDKAGLEQPDPFVTGEDLKRLKYLNSFEDCMQQIGDRNFLVIEETDQLIRMSEWRKQQAEKYKIVYEEQKSAEHQKLFINANAGGAGAGGTTPNHFGHDKLKKKLIQLDGEKNTTKLKRSFHLAPTSSTVTKDKNQKSVSDVSMNANKDTNHNRSWITDNESELEEDNIEFDEETDFEVEDFEDAASDSSGLNIDKESDTSSICGSVSASQAKQSKSISRKFKPFFLHNFAKNTIRKLRERSRNLVHIKRLDQINVGEKIATETLLVYTKVTVKWQNATVEHDIDSTELYPMHHVDDNELFPGDFVTSSKSTETVSIKKYGVVQKVDHLGRTAIVKWFTTYTQPDFPSPKYDGETEESVYDLADHPVFEYRSGTMVIRVANFSGENGTCAAGQVLDCEPASGQVKVRWVDGQISLEWPQDLFELLNHLQNDVSDDSEDSWETSSSCSENSQKITMECPHILNNIERARVAIERLAEIFHLNPSLQNIDVMRKLLSVYKCCRYMDRLLNTNYFHENNFEGLIERMRQCQNISIVALDRKNRLFNEPKTFTSKILAQQSEETKDVMKQKFSIASISLEKPHEPENAICSTPEKRKSTEINSNDKEEEEEEAIPDSPLDKSCSSEQNQLFLIALTNIERAFEKTSYLRATGNTKKASHDDSGNYCDNSNETTDTSKAEVNASKDSQKSSEVSYNTDEEEEEEKVTPENSCLRLCNLLKDQLHKCIDGIREKYFYEDDICVAVTIKSCNDEDCDEVKSIKEEKQDVVSVPLDDEKESTESITNVPIASNNCFQILSNTPKSHKFYLSIFQPTKPADFHKIVAKEHRMLSRDLPTGVWVKAYEDRLDLLSVMIAGPKHTPYEGGLYFFDLQLSRNYPNEPPACHYISFCANRLNPNLYEDGKVCVSLLGTWAGHGSEVWGPKSSLLQLIVSIQGLILVGEPYYNEAGYAKQIGTQQGNENSRMYNEMVVIKMVQATNKLLDSPTEIFREEIVNFYQMEGNFMYERIKGWMNLSQSQEECTPENSLDAKPICVAPEFPLIPGSRGFCRTLEGLLDMLKTKLATFTETANHATQLQ